jgi:hypothetical protein
VKRRYKLGVILEILFVQGMPPALNLGILADLSVRSVTNEHQPGSTHSLSSAKTAQSINPQMIAAAGEHRV